jgi:Rad3-related DNA helicase
MRSDPGVVRNYGRLLLEMASAVPDGIVCFFVSYSYMDGIVNSWNDMGILQVISFNSTLYSGIKLSYRILTINLVI